ncbi:MAG TPA: diguanylate cyclase [Candidatus Competibacter sp.]|nr:diguanylate cyclase [Candidatus Competibacter sp.]
MSHIEHDVATKPKILIADGDKANIRFLSQIIEQDNFDVLTAIDGYEALKLTEKNLPDILLLDADISVIDSDQVIKKIKNTNIISSIPIILIIAINDSKLRKKALEAGVEEMLNKPVNEIELLTRIQSMLRLKRYQDVLSIRQKSEVKFCEDQGIKQIRMIEDDKDSTNALSKMVRFKESKTSRPIRLLLVEDDPKHIKLMGAYLREPEYCLSVASSGEEGLAMANQSSFDLIILDVMLSDIDGFEICRKLKAGEITRHIPVVFTTSLSDVDSRVNGVEAGGDGYLVKPIEHRELWAKIQMLVKKKQQWDDIRSIYESTVRSAIGDVLTGLYNYAYFKHFLDFEIKRSFRQDYKIALMMIDIDNFKNYNDTLGHLAGDLILRELGRIIRIYIRAVDLAARYGGEEFAVILPCTKVEHDSKMVAERIQSAVMDIKLPMLQENIPYLTVSIGIAYCPFDATNADDLIEKADMMLYHAKKTGKNRICTSIDG